MTNFENTDPVTGETVRDIDILLNPDTARPITGEFGRTTISLFSKEHEDLARGTLAKMIWWQPGWDRFWDGTRFKAVGDGREVTQLVEDGDLELPDGITLLDEEPDEKDDEQVRDTQTGRLVNLFGRAHQRLALDDPEDRWQRGWPQFWDINRRSFRNVRSNRFAFLSQVTRGEILPPPNTILNSATGRFISARGRAARDLLATSTLVNQTALPLTSRSFLSGRLIEHNLVLPNPSSDLSIIKNLFVSLVDRSKRQKFLIKLFYPNARRGWRSIRAFETEVNDTNIQDIMNRIEQSIIESYEIEGSDEVDEGTPFSEIRFVVSDVEDGGGCCDERTNAKGKMIKINGVLCKFWASKDNNCAFVTLNHVVEPIKNFRTIRRKIGLKKGDKIDFSKEHGRKLCKLYDVNVIITNEHHKEIARVDVGADLTATLILMESHYYLTLTSAFREQQCPDCSESFYGNIRNHVCYARTMNYYTRKIMKFDNSVIVRTDYKTDITLEDFKMIEFSPETTKLLTDEYRQLDKEIIDFEKKELVWKSERKQKARKGYDRSYDEKARSAVLHCFKKARKKFELVSRRKKVQDRGEQFKTKMERILQDHQQGDYPDFLDRTVVFDFECFYDGQNHQVYAVGYWYKGELVILYGEEALPDFMKFLMSVTQSGTRLVSFNGSGYDHFMILHDLMTRKWETSEPVLNQEIVPSTAQDQKLNVIRKGSKIMYMKFSVFKTLDVYLFLGPASLSGCCKDFKLEVGKDRFPHRYPTTWESIRYKGPPLDPNHYPHNMRLGIMKEYGDFGTYFDKTFKGKDPTRPKANYFDFETISKEYLKGDVRCTLALFLEFGEAMFNAVGMNIQDFMTLPSTSYANWETMIPIGVEIEVPKEEERYEHIGIYGGRTEVIKRYFISDDIDHHYNDIRKYLVDVDVCSLYPSGMQAEYQIGVSQRMSREELDRVNLSLAQFKGSSHIFYLPVGDYMCDVTPRKDLVSAAIGQKDEKGKTVWDLKDRINQPHNWVDIETALRHGYKIKVTSGYRYTLNETAEPSDMLIFKENVDKLFALKQIQDEYKRTKNPLYNPSLRKTIKLILNALYGKCTQKPINNETVFCTTASEFEEFFRNYNWLDMERYGNDSVMMIGEKMAFRGRITKPIQIGAAVLAYSRVIMNDIADAMDPSRLIENCEELTLDEKLKRSWYYTDTDSAIVHVDMMEKLKSWEVNGIKKLGDLEDELATQIEEERGNQEMNLRDEMVAIFKKCEKLEVITKRYLKKELKAKGFKVNVIKQRIYGLMYQLLEDEVKWREEHPKVTKPQIALSEEEMMYQEMEQMQAEQYMEQEEYMEEMKEQPPTGSTTVTYPGKIVEYVAPAPKSWAAKYKTWEGKDYGEKLNYKFRWKGVPGYLFQVAEDHSFLLKLTKSGKKRFLASPVGKRKMKEAYEATLPDLEKIFKIYRDMVLVEGSTHTFTFDMISKVNSLYSSRVGRRPDLYSVHTKLDATRTMRDSWNRRDYIDGSNRLLTVPKYFEETPMSKDVESEKGMSIAAKMKWWLDTDKNKVRPERWTRLKLMEYETPEHFEELKVIVQEFIKAIGKDEIPKIYDDDVDLDTAEEWLNRNYIFCEMLGKTFGEPPQGYEDYVSEHQSEEERKAMVILMREGVTDATSYRKAARVLHPDKNGGKPEKTKRMVKLIQAWTVMKDKLKSNKNKKKSEEKEAVDETQYAIKWYPEDPLFETEFKEEVYDPPDVEEWPARPYVERKTGRTYDHLQTIGRAGWGDVVMDTTCDLFLFRDITAWKWHAQNNDHQFFFKYTDFLFGSAPDAAYLHERMELIPEKDRHFYEIVHPDRPVKPVFDIDGNLSKEEFEVKWEKVIKPWLKMRWLKVVGEQLTDDDLILSESHGVKPVGEKYPLGWKNSLHVLINNGSYFKTTHDTKRWKLAFFDKTTPKEVDQGLYSYWRSFRMPGSCKASDDIPRFLRGPMFFLSDFQDEEMLNPIDCTRYPIVQKRQRAPRNADGSLKRVVRASKLDITDQCPDRIQELCKTHGWRVEKRATKYERNNEIYQLASSTVTCPFAKRIHNNAWIRLIVTHNRIIYRCKNGDNTCDHESKDFTL